MTATEVPTFHQGSHRHPARVKIFLLCITLAMAGCASGPHALSAEERAICKDFSLDCSAGFPGLSEEDRIMWQSGALHQPQCEMDAEGQVRCE